MLRILLIEDDLAMRALVCEWLDAEGYDVRCAARAEAVAEAVVEAVVDEGCGLVIVNILDFRAQGASTLRKVRSMVPDAALIVLSTQLSRSLASDSELARELRVSRLVAKPFSRAELLDAVAEAVGPAL
jgi:DNA-binding response OmpR family regulator